MARSNLTTNDVAEKVIAATKPRYTVELTTEGWQIKDNATGTILAEVWSTKAQAQERASYLTWINLDAT